MEAGSLAVAGIGRPDPWARHGPLSGIGSPLMRRPGASRTLPSVDSDETHRRWCHRPPRHQRGRHHRPLPPDPPAVVALVELVGLDAPGGGRPDRAQRLQRRQERGRLHRRLDGRGPGNRLGLRRLRRRLVVTNHHVIEGAGTVTVKIGTNGKQRPAQIVADDPSHDLALLKVDAGGASLAKLSLGDSSKVDVGDATYAIGNPFGLDHTFTTGVVSALHRDLQAPNGATITGGIQTDAAINPGNSGGPLLDSAGKVIGVNAQIATGSQTGEGANVGIGFAIPSSTVKQFLADAKAGKDAPQQQTQPDPTQQQQQEDPQTDPFGGGQADPQQVDPQQVDPSQIDPQQVDPSQVDPQQVDPSQRSIRRRSTPTAARPTRSATSSRPRRSSRPTRSAGSPADPRPRRTVRDGPPAPASGTIGWCRRPDPSPRSTCSPTSRTAATPSRSSSTAGASPTTRCSASRTGPTCPRRPSSCRRRSPRPTTTSGSSRRWPSCRSPATRRSARATHGSRPAARRGAAARSSRSAASGSSGSATARTGGSRSPRRRSSAPGRPRRT